MRLLLPLLGALLKNYKGMPRSVKEAMAGECSQEWMKAYGLKQAANRFNAHLKNSLTAAGYERKIFQTIYRSFNA